MRAPSTIFHSFSCAHIFPHILSKKKYDRYPFISTIRFQVRLGQYSIFKFYRTNANTFLYTRTTGMNKQCNCKIISLVSYFFSVFFSGRATLHCTLILSQMYWCAHIDTRNKDTNAIKFRMDFRIRCCAQLCAVSSYFFFIVI